MGSGNEKYTEQELLWVAEIAYCNIIEGDKGKTLQAIFAEGGYGLYFDPKRLDSTNGSNRQIVAKYKQFVDDVVAGNICQGWKVVSVKDDENDTGMYALTIETGQDKAIVAFRGSGVIMAA